MVALESFSEHCKALLLAPAPKWCQLGSFALRRSVQPRNVDAGLRWRLPHGPVKLLVADRANLLEST